MIQKEVIDRENTKWTCVQTYSSNPEAADKAEALSGDDGKAEVVCTPSGGAQSVRLTLAKNWMDMQDEEILLQIAKKSK